MQDKNQLIQLSFLFLFVELTLIRWTGANIFFVSFFSNFVLLASFLGMGIGFLRPKSSISLFPFSPILLAIVILFCTQFRYEYVVQLDPITDDLNYSNAFFKAHLFPIELTVPIIFLCVTAVTASIADGVARIFQKFTPLQAYRLNILGSLLGIIVFSLLSFLNAPPVCWGIIIILLSSHGLSAGSRNLNYLFLFLQFAALIVILISLSKDLTNSAYHWSPYYKIQTLPYANERYVVNVNGVPQQMIESVEQRKKMKSFYFFPYEHSLEKNILNNVLIVGAGTGGDVAIALAEGAKHVDAVEIDPVLYTLGKKLNPNQPYRDPRVHVFINDGRAFLQQNTKQYDMIIFALPDSLMILSGQSSLRLENYLFTVEAFSIVRDHLTPMGIFSMYNYYREPWIVDRLANTLMTVFHYSPCLDTEGNKNHWLSVLTTSKTSTNLQCKTPWQPVYNQYSIPSTDNHPFLYLKENRISTLYVLALLFVFLTSIAAFKLANINYHSIKNYFDLFLMGAAFLLLETKNVVNFALLFGSTWFVNSLVFIGILLVIYLAIEFTNRFTQLRPLFLYGLLLLTLFITWLIPNSYLLSLSFPFRFIAATTLAFAPIFVANLIFVNRFRYAMNTTDAFGANLMGAIFGGLLEYSSLIIGYSDLIILIAILYTMAISLTPTLSRNQD